MKPRIYIEMYFSRIIDTKPFLLGQIFDTYFNTVLQHSPSYLKKL